MAKRAAKVDCATLHGIALGPSTGQSPMFVHEFEDASSFLPLSDEERIKFPNQLRNVVDTHVRSLDNFTREQKLPAADLIKVDVQGVELEVFRGATNALAHARAVIVEVSFRDIYSGQPQFGDVGAALPDHGFAVYAFGLGIAPGAELTQVDALFTRK